MKNTKERERIVDTEGMAWLRVPKLVCFNTRVATRCASCGFMVFLSEGLYEQDGFPGVVNCYACINYR